MKVSTCACCGKMLAECNTVWAAIGTLYCSESCGVKHVKKLYVPSESLDANALESAATKFFSDVAEEVDLETIGIHKTIWDAYSADGDITTIMQTAWENEEPLFTEVVGFYFGEPNKDYTAQFVGALRATFIRCEDLDN